MTEDELISVAKDVIYLVRCAVHDDVAAAERIERMDLEVLLKVSSFHYLSAACAMALESAGVHDDGFTQAKGKAIRKNAAMDIERSRLFSHLDNAGIWYLPLKGCVLQDLYPAYGMRQMSDNDILVDAGRAGDVRTIMEELGFSVERFGQGNHDVYYKEPVCNFEIHRSLFSRGYDQITYEYFRDIERRLLPDGRGGGGMQLSREDFYVYLVAHEHKHFSGGGTGMRSLADTYVYLDAYEEDFDWGYVRGELERLGLTDFEGEFRSLALGLFGEDGLTDSGEVTFRYVVTSGAYGTMQHRVENQLEELGRSRYLVTRAFPSLATMESLYPILREMPALLPACWAARLVSAMVTKPRRVVFQLRTAFSRKRDK